MKVGDLVKYPGTVAYGCGAGLVVEMEDAIGAGGIGPTVQVRIFAPGVTVRSDFVMQLQHNLEVISDQIN